MQVDILGPLRVTHQGRPVEVTGPRPRALLVLLALHAGTPIPASRLIDELWGARLPADPGNALQVTVSRLRRALDSAAGRPVVVARAGGYLLDVDPDAVDAARFEKLVAQGRAALADGHPDVGTERLRAACALWRGPALADLADVDAARARAEALTELRLAATEDRIEAELAAGAPTDPAGDLIPELRTLVAEHPLRERLRGQLMRALYRAGRQADALAVYQEGRRVLVEELGLEPGPELRGLERALLDHDPALRAPAPPAARRPRSNLPAALTSFVGRDQEVTELSALLGEARLVTLTGPGGAGKTRLAVEVAARFARGCDDPAGGLCGDGVFLVELAPVRDPAAVARAVASTLGAREPARVTRRDVVPPTELLTRLLEMLERKRLLLVLDNCEHLVEAAARLVESVLAGCPGVRVLATSREALGVPGERRWSVPAMQVPFGSPLAVEDLWAAGATRLFMERAQATWPEFAAAVEADPAAPDLIAETCRRLDGLPLAIELAAARVRSLSVRDIAARLDDRFRLLTGGSRTALPRQQTLRAVVDWSWELLTGPERLALRRLSAFAGGCTLEAAERVCAPLDGGAGLAAEDVLDAVQGLLDKSLLTAAPPSRPSAVQSATSDAAAGAGLRYRMLETVRAYAAERLAEAGETEAAARAHAQVHAELAERARNGLIGRDQLAWYWRVVAETDNLRAAMRWAVDRGEAALAQRTAGALVQFWWMSGAYEEGRAWLRRALALPGEEATPWRCDVLAGLGMFNLDAQFITERTPDHPGELLPRAVAVAELLGDGHRIGLYRLFWALVSWLDGDRAAARAGADDAVAVLQAAEPGNPLVVSTLASAVSLRGALHWAAGDPDRAERDAARALDLIERAGDAWGRVATVELLAEIAEARGDYARAEGYHREALAAAEALGNRDLQARTLGQLGNLAVLQGDFAAARTFHRRSLELAEELGQPLGIGLARAYRGFRAAREGNLDSARHELELAVAYARKPVLAPALTLILAWLGFVRERQGDAAAALRLHQESLAYARRGWEPRGIALSLEGVAGAVTAGGDPERGAVLLGAAAAARAGAGAPLPPAERFDVDRIEAAARAALGEEAFAVAYRRGAGLSLEAAADLAGQPLTRVG